MDPQTLQYYERCAREVAERHAAVPSPLLKYLSVAFPRGARVLDIGAGCGRDVACLLAEGYAAYGIEPSDGMRAVAVNRYPQLANRLCRGALPGECAVPGEFGGLFDGVVCSAVLQHLPRAQLFDATYALRGLLRKRGRALIAIPVDRPELDENSRDGDGRLFNGVTPDELELLFERTGFVAIGRWHDADNLGRPGIRWATLLFELRTGGGPRPLDTIEAVLSRHEKKVATYKLALLRALCDIALTQPHRATWRPDGRVAISLEAVAERWVLYYWPLFAAETFLPQMHGEWAPREHLLAFAPELQALIESYRRTGGLTAYALERRGGRLSPEHALLQRRLIRKLGRTIVAGPVTYAGGSLGERLFGHERGAILVAASLWRELSLLGHWIQDALVLRWADLVSQLSKSEVPPETAVRRLLERPDPARETAAAREVYVGIRGLECVWTGKRLRLDSLAIDHVLPFSLWRNNDLWNLLPADRSVNERKSDRLPERGLLLARREAILHCWDASRAVFPRRFDSEAAHQTGEPHPRPATLFEVLLESVEVTALQRGCQRWAPG